MREAVFRYLFEDDGCGCASVVSVYFLSFGSSKMTDADPPSQFMTRFRGHELQVRPVSQSTSDVARGVCDKETGERGIILRVGRVVWMSGTEIQVRGGYYSNGVSAATSLYQATLEDGRWEVTEVRRISES